MEKAKRKRMQEMHAGKKLLPLLFVMLCPAAMHAQSENGATLRVCEGMTTTKETAQFPLSKVVRLSFNNDGTLVMKTGDGTGNAVAELPMKNDAVMRVTMNNSYVGSQSKHTVTVTDAGYGTFYSAFQIVVPEGAEVHTPIYADNRIKINDDTQQAKGTILPPRTGILLKNAGNYAFNYTDDTPTADESKLSSNCLTGSSVAAPVTDFINGNGTIYSLAMEGTPKVVGFYRYTPTKTVGGKAFLVVPGTSSSKMIALDNEGMTTAIEDDTTWSASTVATPAYNIAGQKVSQSYRGIIIKNGRKILQQR